MYKIDFNCFPQNIITPPVLAEFDNFIIKIAESEEEIKETLRLRYEIFNLEQGHGLSTSSKLGLDFDEFDKFCLHLIVLNRKTQKPVGTYRVHLGSIAQSQLGFYSAGEFDIKGLSSIVEESMELGRSCVSAEFRTGAAVALLWAGIGELMMRSKSRYLFGCVSFEKYNPAAAWALYELFQKEGLTTDMITGCPKPAYKMERPSQSEIDKYLNDIKNTYKEYMPPLFKGYLRLGVKVCSEPVYDSEFKTIDFLILLDSHTLPEKYTKHYNYTPNT